MSGKEYTVGRIEFSPIRGGLTKQKGVQDDYHDRDDMASLVPTQIEISAEGMAKLHASLDNPPAPNEALKSLMRGVAMWDGLPAGDRGDWMQTATGRAFYPLDPRPEEIHIDDIAAALAKLCRFGGHSRKFYSVAEHCVLMARAAPPAFALSALMHDASEAYLSDVIRPIKPFLTNYQAIEAKLERAIADKFHLPYPMPPEVKRMDNAILVDERDQVMAKPPQDWRLTEPELGVKLRFWSPEEAEARFMAAFCDYR